jgi:hypothetical protein
LSDLRFRQNNKRSILRWFHPTVEIGCLIDAHASIRSYQLLSVIFHGMPHSGSGEQLMTLTPGVNEITPDTAQHWEDRKTLENSGISVNNRK